MSLAKASRLFPLMERSVVQQRGYRHVVAGPPQKKTSNLEVFLHGSIMTIMGLSIPTWVMFHLKEYQGRD